MSILTWGLMIKLHPLTSYDINAFCFEEYANYFDVINQNRYN